MALEGWDRSLKKAVAKRERQNLKKQERKEYFISLKKAINYVSIPFIIGILAAVLYYDAFGWEALKKTILSWFIGMTLIATFVASIIAKLDRRNQR